MLNKYKTKLIEKKQLTNDVFLFSFQLQDGQKLEFTAGQYLILSVPQTQGEDLKRLYSITSSADNKDSFELLLKIIPGGRAGSYLSNININSEVNFTGPAGLFNLKPTEGNILFLVTGTGLAPVLSMLRTLQDRPTNQNIKLYWGLPKLTDTFLLKELINLTRALPNFTFKICLSREESLVNVEEVNKQYFLLGRINNALTNIENGNFYLCGSPIVVDSLKNDLLQKGIKQENIHFEKF